MSYGSCHSLLRVDKFIEQSAITSNKLQNNMTVSKGNNKDHTAPRGWFPSIKWQCISHAW